MRFEHAFDPFRSIQSSWNLLKRAPLTVLIGGLLLGFMHSGGGGGGLGFSNRWNIDHGSRDVDELFKVLMPVLMVVIPIALCVGFLMFLFACWLQVGFARAVESAMRTGKDEIGQVFDGSKRFVQMIAARVLGSLITFAAMIPLVVVGLVLWFVQRAHDYDSSLFVLIFCAALLVWLPFFIYVSLGFVLISPVVAYEDLSATESIARSWQLASGNRWRLLWFEIVMTLFSMIGICACCIGGLLTVPMSQVMRFEAYVALKHGDEFPSWWIGGGNAPSGAPTNVTTSMSATTPSSPTHWGSPPSSLPPPEPPRPPTEPPRPPTEPPRPPTEPPRPPMST
jgi:hypothetical protein